MALFTLYVIFITSMTSFVIFSDDTSVNAEEQGMGLDSRNTRVEIRPVLTSCRLEVDGEGSRFDRQELLKHNALHDCEKKLVMDINLISEPDDKVVDEYIPVEHVFGMNHRRFRLLNPYVLRIRRQPTYEIYGIQKINTVAGIITDSHKKESLRKEKSKRDLHEKEQKKFRNSNIKYHGDAQKIMPTRADSSKAQNNLFTESAVALNSDIRDMRETKVYNGTMMTRRNNNFDGQYTDPLPYVRTTKLLKGHAQDFPNHTIQYAMRNYDLDRLDEHMSIFQKENSGTDPDQGDRDRFLTKESITESLYNVYKNFNSKIEEFELYKINEIPSLLFSTRLQLFEKVNTPEGKTAWIDITKDDSASVGTLSREWSNGEFNIRYKSGDWMPRESFALPKKRFCLVVPATHNNKNKISSDYNSNTDFVIVPQEDVHIMKENVIEDSNKRRQNYTYDPQDAEGFQAYLQALVRVAKGLASSELGDVKIITKATSPHIKVPFRRTHRAQIDLEAVADDNDVILVGYSGSLITVVSDTRRSRAILDVKAKNTGLAAARFKVAIRECRPEILSSINSNSEGIVSESEDVPPHHTQMFRLQVPFMDQMDNAICIVALINNDDESVAVREVRLKRDDRCFCIWHCACVCIGEDPQLICHSMSQSESAASGLSSPHSTRYARSVCYPNVSLNFFVLTLGVFILLILLGLVKANLGLLFRYVGSWGLHLILQTPRKLDSYHESSLSNIPVEYDAEGWPVHPVTKRRTVRLVSKQMEYVLNITFFIMVPCIMFWSTIRCIISGYKKRDGTKDTTPLDNVRKCFSSDVKSGRRRRGRPPAPLRRWMSPQADRLTKNIWSDLKQPHKKNNMRPHHTSAVREPDGVQMLDSEQDDTEYVLMEMQKSRVSLDKKRRRLSNT